MVFIVRVGFSFPTTGDQHLDSGQGFPVPAPRSASSSSSSSSPSKAACGVVAQVSGVAIEVGEELVELPSGEL
ncbi:hypothetical protein B0H16DRAFT_1893880 [Mycena metata]|uniref:Uncharacterized protein n=1 Tax=Mycena metata TaxID=1033252 RepID=A0AAD7HXS7_9AGAR|nr:hypothetical protein B0H16DRAFT_1893880 [Mycena metata]